MDYRENQSADTGDFELVYKQKMSSCQAYLGTGLFLHGSRIPLDQAAAGGAGGGTKKLSATISSSNNNNNNSVGPAVSF